MPISSEGAEQRQCHLHVGPQCETEFLVELMRRMLLRASHRVFTHI